MATTNAAMILIKAMNDGWETVNEDDEGEDPEDSWSKRRPNRDGIGDIVRGLDEIRFDANAVGQWTSELINRDCWTIVEHSSSSVCLCIKMNYRMIDEKQNTFVYLQEFCYCNRTNENRFVQECGQWVSEREREVEKKELFALALLFLFPPFFFFFFFTEQNFDSILFHLS